jgi:hypothetical protein
MAKCAFRVFTVFAVLARFFAQYHARLLVGNRTGMRVYTPSVAAANRVLAESLGRGFLWDRPSRRGFRIDRRNRMRAQFRTVGDLDGTLRPICGDWYFLFFFLRLARSSGVLLTSVIFCIICPICAIFDCIIIIWAIISCC